jgi:protein N-terminal amidase
MNWLDPPVEPPNIPEPQDQEAPSDNNLNYWAARLLPLHSTPTPERNVDLGGEEKEVVFVSCNRVGTEEGMPYKHQR